MGPTDSDTEELLTRAGAGDEAATQSLLSMHRDRLRRMIAMRLDTRLSSRLDPSDVVQETLVDATRKLDAYLRERPLPFYPWLHRLAAERLAQLHRFHLRALRREPERERRGGFPGSAAGLRLVDVLAGSGSSPSKQAIREEQRLRVWAALGELTDHDREVLVMRYLEELPFSDIGAILNITECAARVRHFRALQRIGPLLGDPGEGAIA